uniref:Uncharacterized protein n=1 Tax=Musca domestica TaxID=7370 RepID=A0A1I8MTZ3_MUSDO
MANYALRCQIQQLLSALICYDNDYQRIGVEIKKAQEKHKKELDQIIFPCSTKQKLGCSPELKQQQKDFATSIQDVDKMKEAFNKRMNALSNERRDIFVAAKKCFQEMQKIKIHHQRYHLYAIDDLKKRILEAPDKKTRDAFENEMQELNKQFVQDTTHIERCERVLRPFLHLLSESNVYVSKTHCNLKELNSGDTKAKSFEEVLALEETIKSTMGSVLRKLLAMIHIYQPSDAKSFAANYLMHLKNIEDIVKEKLESFE